MFIAVDEFFFLRRTFYLVRLEERGDQELAQIGIRHDWFPITEAEAKSVGKGEESASEQEKQDRLNTAVSSWGADKLTDSILETRFWVSDSTFPIERAGDAVAELNQGLNNLLTQGGESIADWVNASFPLDGMVAGITANFVLEPFAERLTEVSEIFWTAGLVVALATGNIVIAIGCAKALAKEFIKRAVTKAIGNLLNLSPAVITDSHGAARTPDASDEKRAGAGTSVMGREPGQGRISFSPEVLEELREAMDLTSPGRKVDGAPQTPTGIREAAAKDEGPTKGHRAVRSPTEGMRTL